MKAGLKAKIFREYMAVAKTLDDFMIISARKDGFRTVMYDSAHVAMAELYLPVEAFESYMLHASAKEELKFHLEELKELADIAKAEQIINFNSLGTPKLNIGNVNRHFKALELDETKPPEKTRLDLPNWAILPVDELLRGCRATKGIDHEVKFELKDNLFVLNAEGPTDSVDAKFRLQKENYYCEKYASAKYSYDFLHNMLTVIPSETVKLSLGNSTSSFLKAEFELTGKGSVTYLLGAVLDFRE